MICSFRWENRIRGKGMESKWQSWELNSNRLAPNPTPNHYNIMLLTKERRDSTPSTCAPTVEELFPLCFHSTHPVVPLWSRYSSSSRKASLTSQSHCAFLLSSWTLFPSSSRVASPQSPADPGLNAGWCDGQVVQLLWGQNKLWSGCSVLCTKAGVQGWLQQPQYRDVFPQTDSAIPFPATS